MVWDNTRPSNVEKIRDLGTVIRPNWIAIEQASDSDADADKLRLWATNLYDRNNAAVTGANTPTRMDDAGQVYCRDDGDENELFFLDSQNPANEVQITRNDRLGVVGQGVNCSDLMFDDTTPAMTYSLNQMIAATGSFNSNGTLIQGINLTFNSKGGTGVYNIDVAADVLLNSNYKILGTAFSSTSVRVVQVTSKPAPVASTVTTIQVTVRGNSNAHDTGFDLIVVGGR